MQLFSHPATPPAAIAGVVVDCHRDGSHLSLAYRVQADPSALLLTPSGPGRTNELWRHTCFEAFVLTADRRYYELNFAPGGGWAAYAFAGRRAGMRDADAAPSLNWDGAKLTADVDLPLEGDWRVNLTAVIEEVGGTKSYWALAHPDGPPDFHDPACFVLDLPGS